MILKKQTGVNRRQLWQKKFKRNGVLDVSKKIVILNVSPRKKGNTSMLVKVFTEGHDKSSALLMAAVKKLPFFDSYVVVKKSSYLCLSGV